MKSGNKNSKHEDETKYGETTQGFFFQDNTGKRIIIHITINIQRNTHGKETTQA